MIFARVARVARRPIAVLAVALLGCATAAQARYPERPITLVVGASAGGGVDICARLLAVQLTETLHQSVIIENRPGAFARIANNVVAKSRPDGYTLLVVTPTVAIDSAVDPRSNPDPLRDFVPVSPFAGADIVFATTLSLPVHNIRELIDYARAAPGKLNFATPGMRTIHHLEGERLKLRTGIDIVHVPYKGLVQALGDLTSGEVQLAISSITAALPFARAGSVRVLAVASPVRSPLLPDVPTLRESGIDDIDASIWYGLLAPAGTPAEVVATLARAIDQAARSAEYRQAMRNIGAEARATTPAEFGRTLRDDVDRWSAVSKAAGIAAQ